jgi:hypothetical protein
MGELLPRSPRRCIGQPQFFIAVRPTPETLI